MVDEDSKRALVIEFLRRCDELRRKVDKNYQEIIESNGSLEKILEEAEKYTSNHEKE